MEISPGSRLGPYEIIAAIGAGGMGEVYRARDPRIGRDVAIKVLPEAVSRDHERLRRFELEARATGALNHPNLLVVFDIGVHGERPYLVSELLEGETLRDALDSSRIPLRKVLDYAVQIANGVAAAHEKGIIHRDLKPENIFLTADGRVKLLDFGLAKTQEASGAKPHGDETEQRPVTAAGMILGTAGYMSPEQVRGGAIDQRSDIFSFGVVLYEMISGSAPFRRTTSVESMNAILHDEPASFTDSAVPPGLARLLHHALEKAPSRRFESMKDVAFAIDALTLSGESQVRPARAKKAEKPKEISYQRVTFRRGLVMTARFAPDGAVIYGAAWEDKPTEIFSSHLATPEPRALGLPDADLLAISPTGELALSLGRHFTGGWTTTGTLARRSLGGGAPRSLVDGVQDADWTRDGKDLLIIRHGAGPFRIECPIGTVIYESVFWVSHPRWSPKGDRIAFIEHPLWGDDSGALVVIDREGREIARSPEVWGSTGGLAWTPKGDEVWVAAEAVGRGRDVLAMNMSGRQRIALPVAGRLSLHDIDANGRVLVALENARREVVTGRPGDPVERNLSWFDWSWLADLSDDGKEVMIVEQSAAVVGRNTTFVRPTDGSAAVRIGEGWGRGQPFSRDASKIVMESDSPRRLELVPIGAGEARALPYPRIDTLQAWAIFPDEKRLLVLGNDRGQSMHVYEMPFDGDGSLRMISNARAEWPIVLSHGGETVASVGADGKPHLYSVASGEDWTVPGSNRDEVPIEWSPDDRLLYVYRRARSTAEIETLDVTSGARTPHCRITPGDPAGILDIMPLHITPDGSTYAYSYRRFLSDVYVVTGLL